MADDAHSIELALMQARMKAIQHESTLISEVLKLQRMRIVQLEQQLDAERAYRRASMSEAPVDGCRNCGMQVLDGKVFCTRRCWLEYQHMRKETGAANVQRGTRIEHTVQRPEYEENHT